MRTCRCSRARWRDGTTTSCAASCAMRCPTRFAGCSLWAYASMARCRSRRTGNRACTTCCRTRSRTSITSGAMRGSVGVDVRLGTRVTTLITEGSRVSGVACEDASVPRPSRRGARGRRLHQRSRAQIALHGTARGQGRRRQRDRHRRWPEARAAARRADRQWRSRAGTGDPLHSTGTHHAGSPAAAVAGLGAHDGMGDGSRSAGAAAPVHHGFSHDGAGAVATACSSTVRCWSTGKDAASATSCDRPALALPDQPDKFGYILIDARLARQFSAWPHFVSTAPGVAYAYVPDYRRNRPDVYTEASSLAELARKLGMDQQALRTAIAERNAAASSAASADGAAAASRAALSEPPFVALGPVRSVFVHNEGGLAVDASHRVLGAHDQPIPGLYAAGATGQGGLLLKGHGHHLAWAFVSGRRAGRFAAQTVIAAQRGRAPAEADRTN